MYRTIAGGDGRKKHFFKRVRANDSRYHLTLPSMLPWKPYRPRTRVLWSCAITGTPEGVYCWTTITGCQILSLAQGRCPQSGVCHFIALCSEPKEIICFVKNTFFCLKPTKNDGYHLNNNTKVKSTSANKVTTNNISFLSRNEALPLARTSSGKFFIFCNASIAYI